MAQASRLILLIALVVLVAILASSSASAVSDNDAPPTHNDISSHETITNRTIADNSSASATITITMYTGDGE